MITGFNTNVRHGGRTFHVQTEDSGRAHPHIISHVYFGGTILASEKQGYAALLDEDDLALRVRALMEGQHKALVARLRKGALDALIEERLSDSAEPTEPAPAAGDTTPALGDSDTAPTPAAAEAAPRAFGADVVSQKPLDEVILEYLVDKARKRPASRSKG